MIEANIEERIVETIESFNIAGIKVFGAWSIANAGEVKAQELERAPVTIGVAVSPRVFRSYGINPVDIDCIFNVGVAAEENPRGDLLNATFGALMNLIQHWHDDADALLALGGDDFEISALSSSGGNAPQYDSTNGRWNCNYTVTISGVPK